MVNLESQMQMEVAIGFAAVEECITEGVDTDQIQEDKICADDKSTDIRVYKVNKGKHKTTGNASHSNFKSSRKTLRQMKTEILEEKFKPFSKNSQGAAIRMRKRHHRRITADKSYPQPACVRNVSFPSNTLTLSYLYPLPKLLLRIKCFYICFLSFKNWVDGFSFWIWQQCLYSSQSQKWDVITAPPPPCNILDSELCQNNFKFKPAYYFSIPQLIWWHFL